MKQPNISPLLLEKFLRNECSAHEKELVEAWYASLEGETDVLSSLTEQDQLQLKEETFLNIQNQTGTNQKYPERNFPFRWLAGLAASIIIAAGIYFIYNNPAKKDLSVSKQIEMKDPDQVVHFTNHEQRIVMHRLPDSSSVWMHSEASIVYPRKFDGNKRLVTFSGEGFFDIKKDKTRPFSIQSGEMVIKVLGTSFNVKAPVSQKVFQISVVTGSVEVTAPDHQKKEQIIVLKPQQQAIFETQSKRLILAAIPVLSKKEIYEPVTIVFEETPLKKVIDQLEKRFNIHIKLANPEISTCLVTANFEQNALPFIMEMLCTALDASYTISGKVVTMSGLPCE